MDLLGRHLSWGLPAVNGRSNDPHSCSLTGWIRDAFVRYKLLRVELQATSCSMQDLEGDWSREVAGKGDARTSRCPRAQY